MTFAHFREETSPMLHKLIFLAAALACSGARSTEGPVIAEGNGVRITAAQFDAQLALMAPPIRMALQNPERKRQFLDNMIRLELVARAAQGDGLESDPAVRFALKQALAARYRDRFLETHGSARAVSDADVQQYYEQHLEQFSRPARVHVELVFLAADEGSPGRAQKDAQARKLLAAILAREPANPDALAAAARESSDDAVTRPLGGDIGFKTREELETYGREVADAAMGLDAGHTFRSVIATPRGFHLLRVTERQEAQTRRFDDVKVQIATRLASERADRAFEDLVGGLREAASVRISNEALEKAGPAPAAALAERRNTP
jgi:peptidyl-prolyl cis-trans isomerase C